jgi:hypothetical protein
LRQLQTGLQFIDNRQVIVIKSLKYKDEIKKAALCAAFLRNPMVEVVGI